MSNPKEKAKELVNKYCALHFEQKRGSIIIDLETAKQCALIAVELHLEELSKMKLIFSDREIHYNFWRQVKQELQTL